MLARRRAEQITADSQEPERNPREMPIPVNAAPLHFCPESPLNAPETLDQAHALANLAAIEHASLEANLLAARAYYDMQYAAFLERRATLPPEELDVEEERLRDDAFEVECAHQAVANFSPEITVWESGYQFNDRGEDYTVCVQYSPLAFQYEVRYNDEYGERFFGSYGTQAEALARARVEICGHDESELEPRPVPEFSRDESTAAGDVILHVNGQAQAVKTFVDQALDQANSGCGQHYEIFVRRARDALAQLPYHVTAPDEREALTKYLAYDRY